MPVNVSASPMLPDAMTEPAAVEEEISEDAEQLELEFREPMPVEVADGSVIVGDLPSFLADCSSCAAMVINGCMFVLREETLTWVKVEDIRKLDLAIERKREKEAAKEEKEEKEPATNVAAFKKKKTGNQLPETP
jgi:hypothetical protein